ncbi:MAG: cyclic nucleotide-binding domain-containing protein, partial [bacterium]
MNIKENVEILKKCSLFDGLGESELRKIADGLTEQAIPMGTVIIEENDAPREVLYLIKHGDIVVSTGHVGQETENEEEGTFITTLGASDAFGEMALVDEMPHSATVKTISDSVVMLLPAQYFFKLVDDDRNIGYIVIRNIAKL